MTMSALNVIILRLGRWRMVTKVEDRKVTCQWCGKEFIPDSHNLVHLGGHGTVYGCDDCLELKRETHNDQ